MIKVLIKKLYPEVQIPAYKTNGASGMDLMAFKRTNHIKTKNLLFGTNWNCSSISRGI